MHRVEGVGVRLREVVRVGVRGVGVGFHDRQLVKLNEFIISSNAKMVYGVAAHGEMNSYLREISLFFPGNFNLGC